MYLYVWDRYVYIWACICPCVNGMSRTWNVSNLMLLSSLSVSSVAYIRVCVSVRTKVCLVWGASWKLEHVECDVYTCAWVYACIISRTRRYSEAGAYWVWRIYMCIYVCVSICMYNIPHKALLGSWSVLRLRYMHVCARECMQVCIYVCVCMCVFMNSCMHACINCVCMHGARL